MRTAKWLSGLWLASLLLLLSAGCVTVKPANISSAMPEGWLLDNSSAASTGTMHLALMLKGSSLRLTANAEPADGQTAGARLVGLIFDYERQGLNVSRDGLVAPDGSLLLTAAACGQNDPPSGLRLGVRYVDSPPGVPNPPEIYRLKRYGDDIRTTWFTVKSAKSRPDLLIVVIATWNGYLPGTFREELERIALSVDAQ